MGVFAGHDHDNDYVGLRNGIALGFGQVSGEEAYGILPRGARVVELDESKPNQFKSWIRTASDVLFPFYYPSGLTEPTDSTRMLDAQTVLPTKQGVRYDYYELEGKEKTADVVMKLTPKTSGITSNFGLEKAQRDDYFAFRFQAWLRIDEDGLYKFFTYSDDGSKLYIDGELIIDNDGSRSARYKNNTIGLRKGFHRIEVRYFENYMGEALRVGVATKDRLEGPIPDDWLYID